MFFLVHKNDRYRIEGFFGTDNGDENISIIPAGFLKM